MPLNANSNDTPADERDSSGHVSSAEVPVNHQMDALDDSDFSGDDNASDDSNDRYYELLSTQDVADGGGSSTAASAATTTYYQHNYAVNWIDWDQYEDNQQQQPHTTDDDTNTQTNHIQTGSASQLLTHSSINEATNESISDRQISLNDDRINEIKTLMSGFELPKDNIPVWAQDIDDDQMKAFLNNKTNPNINNNVNKP